MANVKIVQYLISNASVQFFLELKTFSMLYCKPGGWLPLLFAMFAKCHCCLISVKIINN